MAARVHEPLPTNLKDRIAALQQRNNAQSANAHTSAHPSTHPAARGGATSPPRGTLKDKIAKFEEKGGTPVPRGSFGIGAPPQNDNPGGKSRELYGNRIGSLGKGRPGAPSSLGRAVTAPLGSTLPDDNDGSSRPSSPDSVSNSLPGAHRRNSSAINRRSVVDIMEQLGGVPPEPRKSRSMSESDSGPGVVIPPESILQTLEERSPVEDPALVSPPAKPVSPPVKPVSLPVKAASPPIEADLAAPAEIAPVSPAPASEVSSPKPSTPDVQPPPASAPVTKDHSLRVSLPNTMSPGSQPSPQPAASESTKTVSTSASKSTVNDDSMGSSSGDISLDTSAAAIVTGVRTVISPIPVRAVEKDTIISPKPVAATTTSPPVPVMHNEEPAFTPTPTTNAKKGFTAVVHRPSTDNQESRPSTNVSRSGTVRSRPSSANLKTNGDPHTPSVVRSKRQFKHLSNTVADPPASPSANDLSSLLKEAAWLEQQLTDAGISVGASESLTLELGSSSLLPSKPTSTSPSAPAPKSQPFPTQAPPDRLKTPPTRDSKDTVNPPTFRVDAPGATTGTDSTPGSPDTKASRTRRYFSLRNALRTVPGSWPRQSISSEMSSDDSAPVATPPSPTFDLVTPPGYSRKHDQVSIRSAQSARSAKSGKSEVGSSGSSLKLSPRRGMARATSFADKLLRRASKTGSMLMDDAERNSISEHPMPSKLATPHTPAPVLPPIRAMPDTPTSLLSTSTAPSSPNTTIDNAIFDAFPSVPQEMPRAYHSIPPAENGAPIRKRNPTDVPTDVKHSMDMGWLEEDNGWLSLPSGPAPARK